MNPALILEIAQLAESIVNDARTGSTTDTSVTAALLKILQNGALAYQQQTGQALDPSLIHAEAQFPSS